MYDRIKNWFLPVLLVVIGFVVEYLDLIKELLQAFNIELKYSLLLKFFFVFVSSVILKKQHPSLRKKRIQSFLTKHKKPVS